MGKIEWTSVKDRLPESGLEVLVWFTRKKSRVMDFNIGAYLRWSGQAGWVLGKDDRWDADDCVITHWAEINPPEDRS